MTYTLDSVYESFSKTDQYLISERPVRLQQGEEADTHYYIGQMKSMLEEKEKRKKKKKDHLQARLNTLDSNPYGN